MKSNGTQCNDSGNQRNDDEMIMKRNDNEA